jgi:predicted RNA-binding Zn-ribbon protein involved in translation (DUF1610 family)
MVSIFESPENRNLKFNKRQLKKWIMEYNPKITQENLEYISNRVMIALWIHRLKRERPEKYREILKRRRKWNKEHSEAIRKSARRRYKKIKNNPILYQKIRESQRKHFAKKYKEDPEFRKTLAKYQREYLKRMKKQDPERYHMIQRSHHICKYTTGVKCPNCGNGIKTATSGHLGKRPIKCPKCGFAYPKKECEKIKIPRILPETRKKIEEIKKLSDEMIITEQAMEGLRNLGMVFKDETEEPREIVGNERKVAENIKKKMIEYVDKKEMI